MASPFESDLNRSYSPNRSYSYGHKPTMPPPSLPGQQPHSQTPSRSPSISSLLNPGPPPQQEYFHQGPTGGDRRRPSDDPVGLGSARNSSPGLAPSAGYGYGAGASVLPAQTLGQVVFARRGDRAAEEEEREREWYFQQQREQQQQQQQQQQQRIPGPPPGYGAGGPPPPPAYGNGRPGSSQGVGSGYGGDENGQAGQSRTPGSGRDGGPTPSPVFPGQRPIVSPTRHYQQISRVSPTISNLIPQRQSPLNTPSDVSSSLSNAHQHSRPPYMNAVPNPETYSDRSVSPEVGRERKRPRVDTTSSLEALPPPPGVGPGTYSHNPLPIEDRRNSASASPVVESDRRVLSLTPGPPPGSASGPRATSQSLQHRGPPPLEKSFFLVDPIDEFTAEIGRWIWAWCGLESDLWRYTSDGGGDRVNGNGVGGAEGGGSAREDWSKVEIEAKIGRLVDSRSRGQRVEFPIATEAILTDHSNLRFESDMTLEQHRHFNKLLNSRVEEQAHKSYDGAPIRYSHTREIDSFHPSNSPSPRVERGRKVRVTRDQKTGDVKDCIEKRRLADLNVFCPQRKFDFRISLNVEIPCEPPKTKPTGERYKDRVSYEHQMCKIDLTQVKDASAANQLLHELEVEYVDASIVLKEGEKYARDEPNMYHEMLQVFLNNVRLLIRNAA